jgi:uncharacterized protein YecE (DUF72 family)
VDRTFYGPVPAETYRAWAEAVPQDFRFLVKAHEALTLARFPLHERYGARRGEDNPTFLDPGYARDAVVAPLVEGLGAKAGPILFQFPPQDVQALGGPSAFADRLHAFLAALPPGPLYAVELRNRELHTADVADVLEDVGALPVLSVWRNLPPLPHQAWRLRARSASALVVRWMLPPQLGYEEARELYSPFDRLVDEDPEPGGGGARGGPSGLCQHQQQGRGQRSGERRAARVGGGGAAGGREGHSFAGVRRPNMTQATWVKTVSPAPLTMT